MMTAYYHKWYVLPDGIHTEPVEYHLGVLASSGWSTAVQYLGAQLSILCGQSCVLVCRVANARQVVLV